MKKVFVLILLLSSSVFAQLQTTVSAPKWSSVTPTSCNQNSKSQALLFNWVLNKLFKCTSGTYSEIGAASPLSLTAASASQVPVTINLASSQTANAFAVKNNSGTTLVQINAAGHLVWETGAAAANQIRLYGTSGGYDFGIGAGAILYQVPSGAKHEFRVNAVTSAQVDGSSTAGHTRFFLYDVDNGALERVTVGAADSCGSGFKCLRIPN